MVDQPLLDAVQWAANFTFWGSAVVFPALTARFWPWWKSDWGWNIVLFELVVGGTSLPYVLLLNWHIHGTWLAWMEAVFLSTAFVVLAWRTVIIWHAQREGTTRDKEKVG
jgi:hypothetical protein